MTSHERQLWSTPVFFLTTAFPLVFLLLFSFPITDGDCFWHLATGRWIIDNLALPVSDPLSFTVTDHNPWRPESGRVQFILQQYWLGQLMLYGTWKVAGNAGIVLLRAFVYLSVLLGLIVWMRRACRGLFPFVLILLVGMMLREIPNERPQLFSFIFMPLVLFQLERISERRVGTQSWNYLILLPVTMLFWANTHGAYILGVVLIVCYLTTHLMDRFMHNVPLDALLLASLCCSALVTCINPAGVSAWREFLFTNREYSASVYETLTPWRAAIRLHEWYPAYWLGISIAGYGFIRRHSNIRAVHMLVMILLIALSLSGLRYLVFPLLAAPIFVRYLPYLPVTSRSAGLLAVCCFVWAGCTWNYNILNLNERWKFPSGAAEFVKRQSPAPNCFNHYDWGGYLAFTIPGFKTFTDGRGLVEEITLIYDQALRGESWSAIFDRYYINTVVLPGISESSGYAYPLVERLAASNVWHLVFADDCALVFVRDIPANKELIARNSMDKHYVQVHMSRLADRLIIDNPNREGYWQTKADALQLLGERDAALAAYRRTLEINPGNRWAKRMVTMGGN